MDTFDVAVIGGGPAGATAAHILARGGARVCIVERLRGRKPCGGGLPSTAFAEFGISERHVVRRVRELVLVPPSGRECRIELTRGTINIVDRGAFDESLREAALQKGAVMLEGDFRGLSAGDGRHRIRIGVGSGKEICIESDYVLGCDGVHSRVRREIGYAPVPSLYTYTETVEGLEADRCEFWFGGEHADRSYSWLFPRAEGCSVGTGVRDARKGKAALAGFLRRRGITARGKGRGYPVPLWRHGAFGRGRVLLAGDAASHVMPLTFEGIYYAMKSASFAARSILEGGGVRQYRKLWDARFLTRFRFMKRLESFFLASEKRKEMMVDLFSRPAVQQASERLWLEKDGSHSGIVAYIRMFGKLVR